MPAADGNRDARLQREIEFHRRIAERAEAVWNWDSPAGQRRADRGGELFLQRSGERRGGEEGRSRGGPYH